MYSFQEKKKEKSQVKQAGNSPEISQKFQTFTDSILMLVYMCSDHSLCNIRITHMTSIWMCVCVWFPCSVYRHLRNSTMMHRQNRNTSGSFHISQLQRKNHFISHAKRKVTGKRSQFLFAIEANKCTICRPSHFAPHPPNSTYMMHSIVNRKKKTKWEAIKKQTANNEEE